MPDRAARASAADAAAALRSGRDWAAWLRQAHAARAPAAAEDQHGKPPTAALAALVHLARRHGFTVERADCGDRQGTVSWPPRLIRIHADLAPAQAVTALAHQLGHVLLHGQAAARPPGGAICCAGLQQAEADSVAYLTAAHLGTGTTAITFPYVSSWAGTDRRARPAATIQAATSRILAAATTITAHLDTVLSSGGRSRKPAGAELSRAGLPSASARPPVPAEDIVRVTQAAQAFFRSRLPGSWVPACLAARGFGDVIQRRWQAGYAPASWDVLTRHLRTLGFPDFLLEAAGVARRSRRGTLIDTFRNRAMLPIRSGDGTVIAFIGRAPDPPGRGVPKYLNSPQTALYDKSETLFGLPEARDALAAGARPVIVEGPLDAIAVTAAGQGRFAGLAPCGTAFTRGQAGALSQSAGLTGAGVLVAFDPDPAGQHAAIRAYHLLSPVTTDTSAVILPPGQDPAQLLADRGPGVLAEILASRTHPLADLVTDTELGQWARWLDHAEGQLSALRAVAPIVAAMPPAHVARQVARISRRLSLDHATVTSAVTTALPHVITRPGRPSPAAGPRTGGTTAGPHAERNHAPADMPALTGGASHEQTAGRPGPPGRPAGQDRTPRDEFPATAAGTVRPAASTTPRSRQPSPRASASARQGRTPS